MELALTHSLTRLAELGGKETLSQCLHPVQSDSAVGIKILPLISSLIIFAAERCGSRNNEWAARMTKRSV